MIHLQDTFEQLLCVSRHLFPFPICPYCLLIFPVWWRTAAGEDLGKLGIQDTAGFPGHLLVLTRFLTVRVPELTPGEAAKVLIPLAVPGRTFLPITHLPLLPTGRRMIQSQDQLCVVAQSLSRVRLFATLWTAARQASVSFTISWSWSNSCPLSW